MPLSLLSLAPQHAIDILLPPSSLLLNDFLLPLASFPLSSSALHKSTRSLDPSKANDHHLFSSAPVSFFSVSPYGWLSFAFSCTRILIHMYSMHICTHILYTHIYTAHTVYTYIYIQYTVHAVLLPCLWRQMTSSWLVLQCNCLVITVLQYTVVGIVIL